MLIKNFFNSSYRDRNQRSRRKRIASIYKRPCHNGTRVDRISVALALQSVAEAPLNCHPCRTLARHFHRRSRLPLRNETFEKSSPKIASYFSYRIALPPVWYALVVGAFEHPVLTIRAVKVDRRLLAGGVGCGCAISFVAFVCTVRLAVCKG